MRTVGISFILLLFPLLVQAQHIALLKTNREIPESIQVLKRVAPGEFVVKIPVTENVRGQNYQIENVAPTWKYTEGFLKSKEKQRIQIAIKVLDINSFIEQEYSGVEIMRVLPHRNVIIILCTSYVARKAFDNDNNVIFVDKVNLMPKVREESMIRSHDLSINTINVVHQSYPELTGNGFNVSVKEYSIYEMDIDLVERVFSTQYASQDVTPHATAMATLIGGAGNSFITGLGVAPEVNLTSASFASLFPEDSAYYSENSISVQNHSYGTEINNYYGLETEAFDQLVYNNPQLIHVISAGNSGSETSMDGPYQSISGFANITGNFKQSKNSLLVTAIDKELEVSELNSRGPAYDGRLKPELTAFGAEGTSEAAALVSGSSVLLQSHFKMAFGAIPMASTLKSLLVAGAEDLGPENIDYITGYGNVNLSNSLGIIDDGLVIEGTLMNGEIESYAVSIPDNSQSVRIAMAWSDPPANPGDFQALINDLDLSLENIQTGQIWTPWVLTPFPHPDSLTLPAKRSIDSLNNLELITLHFPQPGEYEIVVASRKNLTNGNQPFSISSFIEAADYFHWTYPLDEEPLESGISHIFRWQQTIAGETGIMEIKYGESPWEELAGTVDIKRNFVAVFLKDTSALCQARMVVQDTTYYSGSFFISPVIKQKVAVNCDNYLILEWPSTINAIGYEVSSLAGEKLTPILIQSDTVLKIDKSINSGLYYAVKPLFPNGKTGIRSLAINYSTQAAGCYINSFFVSLNSEGNADIRLKTGSIYELDKVSIFKRDSEGERLLEEFLRPPTTEFDLNDYQLNQGTTFYNAVIELRDGGMIESGELAVLYLGEQEVLLFPNPIRNGQEFTILTSEQDTHLEVMDTSGRIVYKTEIRGYQGVFTIKNLNKGIYLYALRKENSLIFTGKMAVF